jgi:cytochrome d ubiquinol oxidase subunit I
MQTPTGFAVVDGVLHATDWFAAVFNPSFPYRLAHMVNASFLTGGLVVLGTAAGLILAGRDSVETRTMMSITLWLLLPLAPLQLLIG